LTQKPGNCQYALLEAASDCEQPKFSLHGTGLALWRSAQGRQQIFGGLAGSVPSLAGLRNLTQEAGRDICTELTRRPAGGEVLVGQLRSAVADDDIAIDSVG
jgi:hypothetical protein